MKKLVAPLLLLSILLVGCGEPEPPKGESIEGQVKGVLKSGPAGEKGGLSKPDAK